MLSSTRALVASFTVMSAVVAADASILSGPVTNPENGHTYYLLNQSSWTAAELEATTMGGHLATVRNLFENDFIFNTFSASVPLAPQYRWLWIGLNEVDTEGDWKWSSGEPFNYANWGPLQPDDNGGVDEDFVGISMSPLIRSLWHDVSETNTANDLGWGVVEIVPEPGSIVVISSFALVMLRPNRKKRTTEKP